MILNNLKLVKKYKLLIIKICLGKKINNEIEKVENYYSNGIKHEL